MQNPLPNKEEILSIRTKERYLRKLESQLLQGPNVLKFGRINSLEAFRELPVIPVVNGYKGLGDENGQLPIWHHFEQLRFFKIEYTIDDVQAEIEISAENETDAIAKLNDMFSETIRQISDERVVHVFTNINLDELIENQKIKRCMREIKSRLESAELITTEEVANNKTGVPLDLIDRVNRLIVKHNRETWLEWLFGKEPVLLFDIERELDKKYASENITKVENSYCEYQKFFSSVEMVFDEYNVINTDQLQSQIKNIDSVFSNFIEQYNPQKIIHYLEKGIIDHVQFDEIKKTICNNIERKRGDLSETLKWRMKLNMLEGYSRIAPFHIGNEPAVLRKEKVTYKTYFTHREWTTEEGHYFMGLLMKFIPHSKVHVVHEHDFLALLETNQSILNSRIWNKSLSVALTGLHHQKQIRGLDCLRIFTSDLYYQIERNNLLKAGNFKINLTRNPVVLKPESGRARIDEKDRIIWPSSSITAYQWMLVSKISKYGKQLDQQDLAIETV